jgi:WD40 repeat protein
VACYDHTVGLYAFSNGRSGTSVPIKLRDWRYPGVPEAVAFSADSKTLIVAQRDDCCLQYIDTESYGVRAVNMNANGDAHVSFNVMDLDVHPGGKYLLTCTDKSRLILTHLDSGAHVRNFYGCVNDAYSMPRGAIDRNLGYVYASSQDRLVYVWDMHRQRIVDRLSHDGEIVRNLALHPTKPLLATVGFGKTLRIFTTADHDSTSLPTTSS